MRAIVIAIAIVAGTGTAHAGWEDLEGGAQLHYELSGEHGLDRKDMTAGMPEPPRELALWTARNPESVVADSLVQLFSEGVAVRPPERRRRR